MIMKKKLDDKMIQKDNGKRNKLKVKYGSADERVKELQAQMEDLWNQLDRCSYEVDAIRVERSVLRTAHDDGVIEGKLKVAYQLLDILDVETIAQKTGFTVEEINDLKKQQG
jgi:DNA repair exonuclease SbcCD ATPase subunit